MKQPKILAFVMAGGEGARLSPLTAYNSKPSLPFGSRYRIVDFVLSNLLNSGIQSIYMLVQYKSQSLIEHVQGVGGIADAERGIRNRGAAADDARRRLVPGHRRCRVSEYQFDSVT